MSQWHPIIKLYSDRLDKAGVQPEGGWRVFGYFLHEQKVPRLWVRKVNWPKAKRGRPGLGTHKAEGRFRPVQKHLAGGHRQKRGAPQRSS